MKILELIEQLQKIYYKHGAEVEVAIAVDGKEAPPQFAQLFVIEREDGTVYKAVHLS